MHELAYYPKQNGGLTMDIQSLISQYNDKIKVLEKELEEARHKKGVLQEAFQMLNEESISSGSESPDNNITVVSDRYSNMSWPDALLLALGEKGEMTGKQLLKELFENGFQSESKSITSDLYGRLKQLEKRGKVVSIKEGNELRRYKIKKVKGLLTFNDDQNERGSFNEDPLSDK